MKAYARLCKGLVFAPVAKQPAPLDEKLVDSFPHEHPSEYVHYFRPDGACEKVIEQQHCRKSYNAYYSEHNGYYKVTLQFRIRTVRLQTEIVANCAVVYGLFVIVYTVAVNVKLYLPLRHTSFLLERGQDLGLRRWAAMGLFGLMYTAAIWATFSLSTLLSHARLEFPSPYYLLAGLCPSAIGIALGWAARKWNVSPRVPAIGLFLLLCVCYVQLKTFGGPLLRPVPILDVLALLLLLGTAGWLLFRRKK